MSDKSILAIIFILIIAIGGFLFLTTPSADVHDFSVEKYKQTTKYESGKTEKDYYIDYGFDLESRSISHIFGTINLYDKHGNLIYDELVDTYDDSGCYNTLNIDKSTYKKIATAEIILYDSDYTTELCSCTSTIEKGENIKDYVDDVEDYTPKTTKISSSSYSDDYDSSSSYDYDSSSDYDSSYDSDYSVYGDYIGNSNTHKFHESFCSWADNIKSSNMVTFSSRQEAIDCGYSPCGHCNP